MNPFKGAGLVSLAVAAFSSVASAGSITINDAPYDHGDPQTIVTSAGWGLLAEYIDFNSSFTLASGEIFIAITSFGGPLDCAFEYIPSLTS